MLARPSRCRAAAAAAPAAGLPGAVATEAPPARMRTPSITIATCAVDGHHNVATSETDLPPALPLQLLADMSKVGAGAVGAALKLQI